MGNKVFKEMSSCTVLSIYNTLISFRERIYMRLVFFIFSLHIFHFSAYVFTWKWRRNSDDYFNTHVRSNFNILNFNFNIFLGKCTKLWLSQQASLSAFYRALS